MRASFMHGHTHTCTRIPAVLRRLQVGFVPVLLYFGYMMLASLLFVLMTGTVGFFSSWWFVWKIFSAVKVD